MGKLANAEAHAEAQLPASCRDRRDIGGKKEGKEGCAGGGMRGTGNVQEVKGGEAEKCRRREGKKRWAGGERSGKDGMCRTCRTAA